MAWDCCTNRLPKRNCAAQSTSSWSRSHRSLPLPRLQHRIDYLDIVVITLRHGLQLEPIDFAVHHHDDLVVNEDLRIAAAPHARQVPAALLARKHEAGRLVIDHRVV